MLSSVPRPAPPTRQKSDGGGSHPRPSWKTEVHPASLGSTPDSPPLLGCPLSIGAVSSGPSATPFAWRAASAAARRPLAEPLLSHSGLTPCHARLLAGFLLGFVIHSRAPAAEHIAPHAVAGPSLDAD